MKVRNVWVAGLALVIMGTACGGSKPSIDTPDGAVRNMQQAMVNNRPTQLFEAMPASYQSDIDAFISDAAQRMDAEIWNESTAVLKQIVRVLASKRDLLLASPMMASVPNKSDVEQNWDTAVSLLQIVLDSEFADIERLRQGNVAGLLSGDGAVIMTKVSSVVENSESSADMGKELSRLKSATVSLVSQDGDTAVVKVEMPDEAPEDIDMVKVEGVWIPKDMADGFKEGIAEARENLANIDFSSEEGKEKKTMILMQLGAIKPMLSQLEAAKTQEDLQAVFSGVMMMLMGGMQ